MSGTTSTTSTTSKPTDPTTTRAYKSAVTRGRAAVASQGKGNWTLGDLATTVETSYGKSTMKRYADDIGILFQRLYEFRQVAAAYADSDRSENSWTVHYIFMHEDDRAALVASRTWTVSEAKAEVTSRNADPLDESEDDDDDSGPTAPAAEDDLDTQIIKASAEVARLEGELIKARARLAKLEATRPAKPAITHTPAGMPAHTPDKCTAACPMFPKPATVTPIKATGAAARKTRRAANAA